MPSMAMSVHTPHGLGLDTRRRGPMRPATPSRCAVLRVRASASTPGSSGGPGVPSSNPMGGTPSTPRPLASTPGYGAGGPGMGGGAGAGAGGNRPVNRGPGGPGGPVGPGGPPKLPSGWSWDRVIFTLLGIAFIVPAWKYVNRRYLMKPEPEHTLAKLEDKAAELKHKGTVSKTVSAVKHVTVEPVKEAVAAVTHSDTARTVQHKVEDVKDAVDVGTYDLSSKAERGVSKAKKEAKHAVDHATSKVEDVASKADVKAHEVKVKGGRTVQRAGEKVSDVAHDVESATAKGTKSVLENIKGAATTVGRKLHVVADATEKGVKKAADKAEHGLGVDKITANTTPAERRVYYVSGGVLLGTGVLAALYYWDRKGGDLKGKLHKLQDKTKEAADSAMGKARDAVKGTTTEPAPPPRPHA